MNQICIIGDIVVSRVCVITGKRPMSGNNVSHANNKTKRRFLPNLKKRRFYSEKEKRRLTLKVSTKALRTIDKYGIDEVIKRMKEKSLQQEQAMSCKQKRREK